VEQIRGCPPLPHLVQPNIAQDSKQPAFHTPQGTQSADRSKSAQARFLDQVLGLSTVTRQHHCVAVQPVQIRTEIKVRLWLAEFGREFYVQLQRWNIGGRGENFCPVTLRAFLNRRADSSILTFMMRVLERVRALSVSCFSDLFSASYRTCQCVLPPDEYFWIRMYPERS